MVERLDGMVQSWLDIATLEATQSLLARGLSDLHPSQDFPLLTQNDPETFNLWAWRLEWAEAFILHNSTFSEALWLTGMGQPTFPATPFSPTHPQFEPFLEVHQDTHLEAWLMALSATLQH